MSAPGWSKWLLIVAVLLLVEWGGTGRGAQGADAPPKIAAFLKQCETSRRWSDRAIRAHPARPAIAVPDASAPARNRRKSKPTPRALRANDEPVVAPLAFPPEKGAIGRLPRLTCHVKQVLSEREMLVECYFPVRVSTVRHFQARGEVIEQTVTFLIRGVSTEGAEEGTDLELLNVLETRQGKQTYKTVEGGTRSVWVLNDFDMKAVEPYSRRSRARR